MGRTLGTQSRVRRIRIGREILPQGPEVEYRGRSGRSLLGTAHGELQTGPEAERKREEERDFSHVLFRGARPGPPGGSADSRILSRIITFGPPMEYPGGGCDPKHIESA
ncbi:hypothetical protein BN2537_6661 [Streptomyces venezuelae]|nr:hypothetical protein BN2537_6661 [Streptomyces venezuelae]